ncbi:Helix-turn-helix domain-containing protein [Pedobacter steynii]|uniref:Helix-turn-helix domain-containing protein n=1 Tax=Pedobacter steynii TaxID=430522 RepID=A0A1G9R8C0_9SPHI|nr:helix-turn-helix domain-containing protein [Pedobacter steynii]NQX37837.1 helix-turn-helix transcriptional regulator [Pedobacter steynii]SDM19539.1 Helix-turn-helix domain-containing protein [Pedobacter steynii]
MAILLSSGNYFGIEKKFNEHPLFKLNLTHYAPAEHIHEHYHENAYLSLLIKGNYEEVNKRNDGIMNPGEVILRPSGYRHANSFGKTGGSCMNIEFKKDALDAYGLRAVLPELATTYQAGAFSYLYKLLYFFSNDLDPELSEEYIFNWLSAHQHTPVPSRLVWLPKVKKILETELETQHTIDSISERVFVHPIYLARAFREREGLTIGEYKLQMRVKKSMELLFSTKLSISEIAYTTGFSDAAHFIKSFRLYYPVSPHKFRSVLKG